MHMRRAGSMDRPLCLPVGALCLCFALLVYCVYVYRSDGRSACHSSVQIWGWVRPVVLPRCQLSSGTSAAAVDVRSRRVSGVPVTALTVGLCAVPLLACGSEVEVVLRCVPLGCVAEALLLLRMI
jgi:hypothetical protein